MVKLPTVTTFAMALPLMADDETMKRELQQVLDEEWCVLLRKMEVPYSAVVESEVTSAREAGGLVLVDGRLRLTRPTRREMVYESRYLHVFRRNGERWEIVAVAASAVAEPAP